MLVAERQTGKPPIHDDSAGGCHGTQTVGEKLRESQNRLEGIIASAMDAIIAVDQEHRIVVFNTAAEKMFVSLIGRDRKPDQPLHPGSRFRTAHTEHIRHFGETGMTKRAPGALWALRQNGDEFP